MAREVEDIQDSPYFVTERRDNVVTKFVNNPPVKIHRAASESFGKSVNIEYVNAPEEGTDWLPSNGELNRLGQEGPTTGFYDYEKMQGQLGYDSNIGYDRESRFRNIVSEIDEKHILEVAERPTRLMSKARVHRDPETLIPDNVAEVDRTSESTSFFGKDKPEAETTTVLKRMVNVDKSREGVDYKSSKAVPIRMITRRP